MEGLGFIDLTATNALILFLVGVVGGMVSGFIGSGGAFVLTPAMMSMGVPGVVAVASNIAHKFPKALVGAHKRNKYGQVDIKLGIVMGLFAEVGMLTGKHFMVGIKHAFGEAGTNLYVSFVFVVVLGIVGTLVLRDALRERRGAAAPQPRAEGLSPLVQRVRAFHVPGTMIHFKSIDARVSFLVIAPLGFATGLLAGTIAVGGFIGVPAMMYVLGLPALMASATELVIAFVMGLGGTLFYALDGLVDIRIAMVILAGSLFGIQVGAIGTTYVKDYAVKLVMAAIMLIVMLSRFFYIPGYLDQLGLLAVDAGSVGWLNGLGQGAMVFALVFGAAMILKALYEGMREHRLAEAARLATAVAVPGAAAVPVPAADLPLSPLGRFARFVVASDDSEFSAAAVREGTALAKRCGAELHAMSLVATGAEHEALGEAVLRQEMDRAQAHLDGVRAGAEAAGVRCATHVIVGAQVHAEIVELAEEVNADLIVMGRRGRRGLARLMLGHATAQVIGLARCNVLVVPRAARVEGRRLVLATDGSRFADAAAVTAGNLALACGAPVTVVSAVAADADAERRAEAEQTVARVVRHLADSGINADGEVLTGEPAAEIVRLATARDADLIVTGSHGHTGLTRVLLGSTSERILNETVCAVLVVKAT